MKLLGLLSDGSFVEKKPSDFTDSVVRGSAKKTQAIMDSARGKVLLIDEAYSLNDQQYGKEVLDTIVGCLPGKPGADIVVIMAGYRGVMDELISKQNDGLASRFNSHDPFVFEDFNDEQLMEIMTRFCRKKSIVAKMGTKGFAVQKVSQMRALPKFGNARVLENYVAEAIVRMGARLAVSASGGAQSVRQLEICDFASERDGGSGGGGGGAGGSGDPLESLRNMFKMEDLCKKLDSWRKSKLVCEREGRPVQGPPNFVFSGSAGTGKVPPLLPHIRLTSSILSL